MNILHGTEFGSGIKCFLRSIYNSIQILSKSRLNWQRTNNTYSKIILVLSPSKP